MLAWPDPRLMRPPTEKGRQYFLGLFGHRLSLRQRLFSGYIMFMQSMLNSEGLHKIILNNHFLWIGA